MKVRIGLENNIEGRSLAWALEHPGCFAYGSDGQGAILAMAQAIPAYIEWMREHTDRPWFAPEGINIDLVDVWDVYEINHEYERVQAGYEVNAWFLHDWKPLTEMEIDRGLQLLSWTRADLEYLLADLSSDLLDRERPEERWSIRGIVGHIGTAEWWYLNRLGRSGMTKQELPADVFERMGRVRSILMEALPLLQGVKQVVGVDGEFWSPRKVLRRAVWHEMDHILHIRRLLSER